jgi:hypothetical protein
MGTVRCLLLAFVAVMLAAVMLPAGHAVAQAPWPGDPPRGAAAAPWPGSAPQPGGMAPPGMMAPGMGAPRPPAGGAGMGGGGGGGAPPCMAEFTRLREDLEKRHTAAKAGGERKADRAEMCKLVASFAEAAVKWVKYTESHEQACGIPGEVVGQLKQMRIGAEKSKQQVCAAGGGPAGPMPGPSISEAITGSTRLATPDSAKLGNGTFDTMTGGAFRQ